jgi:hypothetical protein
MHAAQTPASAAPEMDDKRIIVSAPYDLGALSVKDIRFRVSLIISI